jgi:capsular polysaccharide biosynthesis protein
MELIQYYRIVVKRWWLIVGLVVVVGVVSLLGLDGPLPPVYSATLRVNVGLQPVPPADADYRYNPLDTWMSSEYFMDDLASAVRGAEFARRVSARFDGAFNLAGVFGASTHYRVLTVSATWVNPEELAQIANAALDVLESEAGDLVGPLGQAKPVLRLIDPPVVVPVGQSLKDKLDIPIRLGLALVAGVAGTFLLDYLDTSVRGRPDVETLGIAVLAEIPRHK